LKYFTKLAQMQRRMGQPKSDLERVMTHYKVSEEEAKKMLKEKSAKDLLPKRGERVK
jgi:NACalpha-BTF3-like transcription factor